MQNFYNWQKQNKYAESTIQVDINNLNLITTWAKEAGHSNIEHLRYQDLLAYVQYEKGRAIGIPTLNQRLQSLRKYYEYLKEEGIVERNPAGKIYIKGAIKKVITNQLGYKELETLYRQYVNYVAQNPGAHNLQVRSRQRNIILLSLLIWQGLHSGELEKLKLEYLNLNTGILYIPSSTRNNSRELRLESFQILPFNTYLKEIRPQQKPKRDELFPGRLQDIVSLLIEELKGLNEKVNSANQIRASVILYWLKLYDKRQVQYMLGYKHISSVERYEQQDLETLTDQLKKHHPFG